MRYSLSGILLLLATLPIVVGQDKKGTEYTTEYFPLKVGERKVYLGNDGKEKITVTVEKSENLRWRMKNGQGDKSETLVSYILRTTSGDKSLVEQIVVTPDGVFRYASAGKEITPPLRILKLPPKAGESWPVDSESETIKLAGTFALEEATIDLPGKVKVPTLCAATKDFYVGKEPMETKYWFAKGIGIVKQQVKVGKFDLKLELVGSGNATAPTLVPPPSLPPISTSPIVPPPVTATPPKSDPKLPSLTPPKLDPTLPPLPKADPKTATPPKLELPPLPPVPPVPK
jgi:hypothetical protein